jgi:uncharacterized coiled-coil protein SlyX
MSINFPADTLPAIRESDDSIEARLDRLETAIAESTKLVTEIHTAMVFLARQAQALQGSPLAKLLKIK